MLPAPLNPAIGVDSPPGAGYKSRRENRLNCSFEGSATMRSLLILLVVCCVASADAQELVPRPATDARASLEAQLAAREAELKALQAEVGRLQDGLGLGEPQLRVEVKIILLSHNALRKLGIEFPAGKSALSGLFESKGVEGASIPTASITAEDPVLKQLDAWIADPSRPAVLAASPVLVTPFGKPTFMKIGNETPILVPDSRGGVTVEHRFYGKQLDVAGKLLESGAIELNVRPRDSELDPDRSVSLNGQEIPGLTVRECDLNVTLRPDQVLLVYGMLQTRITKKTTPLPRPWQKGTVDEEEMVLIVTPSTVKPKPSLLPQFETATRPGQAVAR
jgi:Flp pilus assembly secretin CpaC